MLADHNIVADLHEVVDFGAFADDGFSEASTVNRGVGSDFDIVANFHDADLVDLHMAAL